MVNLKVVDALCRYPWSPANSVDFQNPLVQCALFLLALTSKVLNFKRPQDLISHALLSDPGTVPHYFRDPITLGPKADSGKAGPTSLPVSNEYCGRKDEIIATVSSHKTLKFICLIDKPHDQEVLVRVVVTDYKVLSQIVRPSLSRGQLLITVPNAK